jgi:hypothetical protein
MGEINADKIRTSKPERKTPFWRYRCRCKDIYILNKQSVRVWTGFKWLSNFSKEFL